MVLAGAAVMRLAAAAPAAVAQEPGPIDHPLFDANRCLERIETSPLRDLVSFHWGCGERDLLTMECVLDVRGYGGSDARPGTGAGWHCNHPLPLHRGLDGQRVSDAAVATAGDRVAWAACFIPPPGDPADPEKPHRDTDCYRALLRLRDAVDRDRRDPHALVRGGLLE